jgi:TRAP-type C4-dicarboxylate transport system permease small subunit
MVFFPDVVPKHMLAAFNSLSGAIATGKPLLPTSAAAAAAHCCCCCCPLLLLLLLALTWSAMRASTVLVIGHGTLALTLTVTSIWQPSLLLLISSSALVLRLLASDICGGNRTEPQAEAQQHEHPVV